MADELFSVEYKELMLDLIDENKSSTKLNSDLAAQVIAMAALDPELAKEKHSFNQILNYISVYRSIGTVLGTSPISPGSAPAPPGATPSPARAGWRKGFAGLINRFTKAAASSYSRAASAPPPTPRSTPPLTPPPTPPPTPVPGPGSVSPHGGWGYGGTAFGHGSHTGWGGGWGGGSSGGIPAAGGGPGDGEERTGFDYWRFRYMLPQSNSVMGQMAGIAGAIGGQVMGGPLGSQVGEISMSAITKVIESFAGLSTNMRDFAVNLKESNRRFQYFNAAIGQSYVQSDMIAMVREIRLARAVAPTTIGLNQALDRYQETRLTRDIFAQNMANTSGQVGLGMGERFESIIRPLVFAMESLRTMLDPSGGVGVHIGKTIADTMLMFLPGGMMVKNALDAQAKPPPVAPVPMFGWESMIMNPKDFKATDHVFNQKNLDRGRKLRF